MHRWTFHVAVLTTLLAGCGSHATTTEPSATPSVAIAPVRYGTFAVVLTEVGSVGAPQGSASQLAFPIAGTIASISVRPGERVVAGQVLASLDTRTFALAAQQASADARAASAQASAASVDRFSAKLNADRAALDRATKLFSAGVTPAKDIEAARAQLAADEADARSAVAGREAANASAQSASVKSQIASTDVSRATLTSPVSGVVTAVLRRIGETVDPTIPVVTVGSEQQTQATLQVPAADAAQIKVGDPVEVSVAQSPQHTRGRVISVVPAVDPTTEAASIVITGVPQGAVAGSAITARIAVAQTRGLLIPQTSVVQDPQSGDNVVFVLRKQKDGSMKFEQRTVTVAHEDGVTAQVTSGVSVGERIAAQGAFELLSPAGG